MTDGDTQGGRIRALFEAADGEVAVIAPFIKVAAMHSLLEVIPSGLHLRCVSRWLPREIAAGVSDPEILDLLETRGNFSFSLVDRLHAKLYIAGDRCLVGSANVTLAGLGDRGDGSNIEVLVESTLTNPEIVKTLEAIAQVERVATISMARTARCLANRLAESTTSPDAPEALWFPRSRRPEQAYRFYADPPDGFVGAADAVLLDDLASTNLPPGLREDEFEDAMRSLLGAIPPAGNLLEASDDITVTRADTSSWLEGIAGDDYSANDLWIAFVNWMALFFPDLVMRQEIVEVALRRAKKLH